MSGVVAVRSARGGNTLLESVCGVVRTRNCRGEFVIIIICGVVILCVCTCDCDDVSVME